MFFSMVYLVLWLTHGVHCWDQCLHGQVVRVGDWLIAAAYMAGWGWYFSEWALHFRRFEEENETKKASDG